MKCQWSHARLKSEKSWSDPIHSHHYSRDKPRDAAEAHTLRGETPYGKFNSFPCYHFMDKQKEETIDKLALQYEVPMEDYCIYRHNKEWFVSVKHGDKQEMRNEFMHDCYALLH
jgi:hypothetical protein